ncbi:MAG: OmpA family protein, partial [Saprospiraceae bacterium]|nr:OmpA family protein [Saprospiraceae bacterium]
LPSPINNAFPNSLCALGNEEEEAIVLNQWPKEGGIKKGFSLIQKTSTYSWTDPVPIVIEGLGDIEPDVNLALTHDGAYLMLSIQRGDSYGKSNDLYVCERKGLTTFSEPIHLGPAINSPYHEAAPFLSPDGKTLFFSSNRRGMGGADIYFVNRLEDGWSSWSAPRALMSPVNSSYDESHPYFIERTGYLYFSSKRDGTSDIYRVQIAPPNSSLVNVTGRVTNGNSNYPVRAYLIAEPLQGGNFRKVVKTNNGSYKMTLPKGDTYEIEAQGIGFLNSRQQVSFPSNYVYFQDFPLDFKMIPSDTEEAFVLENIQFQQSTAILLDSSVPTLERLASIMTANPGLVVLIEGHTDNVGLKSQLLQLSEDRAQSIKNYLSLNHAVAEGRILTMGRGDLKPLNSNETEDLRSMNRRVEVSVLSNDWDIMSTVSDNSQ